MLDWRNGIETSVCVGQARDSLAIAYGDGGDNKLHVAVLMLARHLLGSGVDEGMIVTKL